jgi:hypothetical protein
MSDTMLPYDLYGLTDGNPYVQRALDPLKWPSDSDRLLGLNGFVQHERVLTHLRRKIADKEPAFILIGGRNLTGRTSMANWVLDKYLELYDVERRFVPIRAEITNHENFDGFRTAMAQLWARTKTGGLSLNSDVAANLKQILDDASPDFYQELFQVALHDVWVQLDKRQYRYALGFLFEGVKNAQFVTAARTIFGDSAAVVVFTYDDYDHAQTTDAGSFRAEQFDDMLNVYLEPLAGQQVCVLAERRWQDASERKLPFDAAGLEALYRNRPTPIKMVLKRLEGFLDYRLELAALGAAAWPDNHDLFMSGHWLMTTSKFKEKSS